MAHPPLAQLSQDGGLAGYGQFSRPFTIYSQPITPGRKREIDQLEVETLAGLMVYE